MSESEEMYLVVIARANENGQELVPVAHLSTELNVQPVSANQMIKKLEEAGKVIYTPYKGVELTPTGKAEAARILRHRRLWEVFLAEKLGFNPGQADEIACRLEHVVSDDVAERLSAYLGSPQTSPQGKPIPERISETAAKLALDVPLASLAAGEEVVITAIKTSEAEKNFLRQTGILLGGVVKVLAIQSTGACLLQPQGCPALQLSAELAHNIRARR